MSRPIVCPFTQAEAEALHKHLTWATAVTNDTALFDASCKLANAMGQKPLEWSKEEARQGGSGWYRRTTATFCGYQIKVTESPETFDWSWYFGDDHGFCCVDGNRKYDRIEDAKADAESAVRIVVALFGRATK